MLILFERLVVVLLLHQSLSESKDLLRLFRPKPDLPQELNDFLTDVQHHRKDFAFIRNVAKNRRKYEKSFRENKQLFAEDIDNQMSVNADDNNINRQTNNENSNAPPNDPKFIRPYHNEERFSKFLHSPLRLRRRMDIKINSAGNFGNVERSERKFPRDDDQNKYHTGYMVGIDDEDDNDDYDGKDAIEGYDDEGAEKAFAAAKKKREVEISIKSDGKLVKQLEETENGPKSIVLNIKSDGAATFAPPTVSSTQFITASSEEHIQDNNNYLNNIPSNSKTIPNEAEAKNGIPMNNGYLGGKGPTYNPSDVSMNIKNDNIEKTIDMAQNNVIDSVKSLDIDLPHDDTKKNEFEKVQGLIMEDNGKLKTFGTRQRRTKNDYYSSIQKPQFNENHPKLESAYWETGDDQIHLNPNQSYEIIEKSTKDILMIPLVTTTECQVNIGEPHPHHRQHHKSPEEVHQEAKAIGEAIAKEIEKEATECDDAASTKGGVEEFEIIEHHKPEDCDDGVEEMEIVRQKPHKHGEHHKREARRKAKKRKRKKKRKEKKKRKKKKKGYRHNKISKHGKEGHLRTKKHSSVRGKYKKKRVRQHPQKRIHREPQQQQLQLDFYDVNEAYESPEGDTDFIPAYQGRRLQSTDYEFDPSVIQDFDNHEKEAIEKFEQAVAEQRDDDKNDNNIKGIRKKFKSEGDYSDEEDSIVASSTRRIPIKKTLNKFAFANGDATTEDNDDDYNYSDLTDMDDEDEDIAYEEETAQENNLEIDEPVAANSNRNDAPRYYQQHEQQPQMIGFDLLTTAMADASSSSINFDDVLFEANEMLAGAHGHGDGAKKKQKKKKKPPKRERKDVEDGVQKSLTDGEKQELFLRSNPDFQRWPRFVQSDSQYQNFMRQRALKRHSKNDYYDNFPLTKREYFIGKREEPSSETEASTATEGASSNKEESSVATSEVASSVEVGASESAATAAAAETGGGVSLETTAVAAGETILQEGTVSSESFENVTTTGALGIEGVGGVNSTALEEGTFAGVSTQFQFTTNAADLTTNTQCDQTPKEVTPCQDEKASHSPVTITSVLPLIKESATKALNITKEEYLDLNEIVGGNIPREVVSQSISGARGSVRQSLRSSSFNMNLLLPGYNTSAETSLILNEMTKLMMKLKYHSTCQALSPNLMTYVKIITGNTMDDPMAKLKEMNEIDFDEHQSNYMFHSGQEENVNEKAEVLKELLNKYNQLPDNCKERAEPVKEYIESHLAMIEHVTSKKGGHKGVESTIEPLMTMDSSTEKIIVKKDAKEQLEEQMMLEGLNNQKTNANEKIEEREKVKREIVTSTSPQYGRLANAVKNMRNRREIVKRISEIYGRSKREEKKGKGVVDEGFEAPQVINL